MAADKDTLKLICRALRKTGHAYNRAGEPGIAAFAADLANEIETAQIFEYQHEDRNHPGSCSCDVCYGREETE